MRGIAALAVATYHLSWMLGWKIPRAYLAVDLFFLLSGFVIARAYGEKLATGGLSVLGFVKVRMLRLYPVYALGICTAALLLAANVLSGRYVLTWPLLEALGLNLVFLPAHIPDNPDLYPTNFPAWSLMFEILANLVFALLVFRLPDPSRRIGQLALLSGVALIGLSLAQSGLNHGPNWGSLEFLSGLARASYGVLLGAVLYRHQDRLIQRLPAQLSPWLAMIVAMAAMFVPSWTSRFDVLFDLSCALLLFPIMVMACASREPVRGARILNYLGSASYPLYILHIPLAGMFAMISGKFFGGIHSGWGGIVFFIMMIPLCVVIENRLDIPLRRLLSHPARALALEK
ncbi:hypothetical protein C6382_03695 [Pseudomonas sp. BBP2017]|nr:hypothetical protein C6382_03695 [Pseudomonas sp. BBP2017]